MRSKTLQRTRRNPVDVFSVSKRDLNRAFEEGFEDRTEHPDLDPDRALLAYIATAQDLGRDAADAYILGHAYYLGALTAEEETKPNPEEDITFICPVCGWEDGLLLREDGYLECPQCGADDILPPGGYPLREWDEEMQDEG
jgi:rubrerythrin